MQAQTHSPAGIFGSHVRYVIPIFQRPYVWGRDAQWEPLWQDVRAVAERLLLPPVAATYGAPAVSPHFLGAVVLDQQMIPSGYIPVRHVIDGQQRLTTLQILLDAAQEVVAEHGNPMDAQALLVLNDPAIAQHADEVFKVWPTDRDQPAFRAAMTDGVEIPVDLAASRLAQAHAYFGAQVREWSAEESDFPQSARLGALVRALRDYLRVVIIDLEPGDNAQVIFETLNHRGSPLLAGDLVKNLLFQVAQAQGADVQSLYEQYWKPLDSDEWRQLVAQGRLYRPRVDQFLNYWLTMKLAEEVPADQIFTTFRDRVVTGHPQVSEIFAELAADADVFAAIDKHPQGSAEGDFYYRVVRAMDSSVVSPFLLWVLRAGPGAVPAEQRARCLRALESWLVRRVLCRSGVKDLNRLVIELLRAAKAADSETVGDAVEQTLSAQRAESRFWPGDRYLKASLRDAPVYTLLTRPRLRMLLEALEDARRSTYGEGIPCPRDLTVEHVMPQAWREHWGADIEHDLEAQERRDQLVQSLGNLTLVTGRFNSLLSNRPWTDTEASERGLGKDGKRDYLLKHSQLKLNADLVADHATAWTEDDILLRCDDLVSAIAAIWPRPESAGAEMSMRVAVEDPVVPSRSAEDVDDEMNGDIGQGRFVVPASGRVVTHIGKYRALWAWLIDQDQAEIRLTFADVEQILGIPLPNSARMYTSHWYGYEGSALARAIIDAGWKALQVNLTDERVVFLPADR